MPCFALSTLTSLYCCLEESLMGKYFTIKKHIKTSDCRVEEIRAFLLFAIKNQNELP